MLRKEEPVFIIGSPRSGNTLLGALLNKHSECLISFEKNWYSGHFPRVEKRVKNAQEDYPTAYFEEVFPALMRHQEMQFFTEEELKNVVKGASSFKACLMATFELFREKYKAKAKIWGDKTPVHIGSIPNIVKDFPEAKFLFVKRNPFHIVNSLKNERFVHASDNELACALEVYSFLDTYNHFKALYFGSDNFLEIDYEQLIAEPTMELEKVCAFLGIPFEKEMLEEANEETKTLIGWPEDKAWGALKKQHSSKHITSKPTVHYILQRWTVENKKRRSLKGALILTAFKGYNRLLSFVWRLKYPSEHVFLVQKLWNR